MRQRIFSISLSNVCLIDDDGTTGHYAITPDTVLTLNGLPCTPHQLKAGFIAYPVAAAGLLRQLQCETPLDPQSE